MIKLLDILLELEKKPNLFSIIKLGLDELGFVGKPESKRGRHLRYSIGNESDVISSLNKIMKDNKIPTKNYTIDIIDVDDFKSGAKSGKYKTYKIISGNEEVYVVNQQTEKSTLVSKALTPSKLGLEDKEFTNISSVIKTVESHLKSPIKDLLSSLMKDVNDKSSHKKSDKLENFSESISLSDYTAALSKNISETDMNIIGKDFGEVLGAILLFNKVNKPTLTFPGGNNPLIDFTLNDYKVSSKYKTGAAATLTEVIKGINPDNLKKESQIDLYKVFEIVVENKVSSGYLEVAKYLEIPALNELSKVTKIPISDLTTKNINDFINKTGPEKSLKLFKNFYDITGRGPKGGIVNWDKISKEKYYGIIIGPLSYAVIDYLNSKGTYKSALKEMLSKIEVKQLYLNIHLGKRKLDFNLKSFSDAEANFTFEAPNQSIYNPDNGRLGFKLK